MVEKYNGRPVLRTPLIVAGHNKKYLDKAFSSECDCIVMDLEDGVPKDYKAEARKRVYETLNSSLLDHRPVFVRVNSLETGLTEIDVDAVACESLDGFLYTKPYKEDDILLFDKILEKKENELKLPNGFFKIIVIMETPLSILNAKDIAFSSRRIVALLFGAEDLLGDMEGTHSRDGRSLVFARTQVLMACRAANLIPIDTPYIDVHNYDGLREFIKPAKELGYEGMLLISPSQIPVVKEMYTPNQKEVDDAYIMDNASKENEKKGSGASLYKKMFVSPPTLKQARHVIRRYENITKFENFFKD